MTTPRESQIADLEKKIRLHEEAIRELAAKRNDALSHRQEWERVARAATKEAQREEDEMLRCYRELRAITGTVPPAAPHTAPNMDAVRQAEFAAAESVAQGNFVPAPQAPQTPQKPIDIKDFDGVQPSEPPRQEAAPAKTAKPRKRGAKK